MIELPTLASVPPILSGGPADQFAARCALALADPGPIPRVRTGKSPVEVTLLQLQLYARLFHAARPLEIFRPKIHVHLGAAPAPCQCCESSAQPITVWIGNANGHGIDTRWTLERRWNELERAAPGLASTALHTLHRAHWDCVPLYTPPMAIGMAQWTYWRGETDERWIIEEYAETEEAAADETEGEKPPSRAELAEQLGVITKARIDAALPRAVSDPKRALKAEDLERIAHGRGAGREVATRTLALLHEIKATRRRKEFSLHVQQDEVWALGFAAMVRWNARDPMGRIIDDHAQHLYESSQLEEAWGWFIVPSADKLRAFFAHLEERLALARRAEELLAVIAHRARE